MTSLRAKIQGLRRPVAGEAKSLVPHQELYRLLTRSEIDTAVRSCHITKLNNLDEVVDKVYFGGRRIFAILVVLNGQEKEILRFIEHDHYQDSPLDHKLPFAIGDLEIIAPDIAIDFYEKQWEFAAPVFTRGVDHRLLDIRTALPFEENTKIGDGGFGEVFRISLYPGHQDISLISPNKGTTLARKQFSEILNDGDTSHEQELKNLCLLNQLKHPNILELLTFYTYQRKRNFLFPLASGGDIEALFRAEHRQTTFNEDFMFYRALSGLSDAIEKLHDYKADKNLELRLIGLHQDLKPSNILVDGDDFILADFGLSKFKSGSQTSHTPFRIGGGDYLAPECEDYDEGMRKGLVNRSSDIWSLGCIIAEVLTYMLRGAKGVVEFRDKRKVKVGAWTVKTFYTAGGKVNPNVLEWLSDLKLACPPPGQQLVELVKTILSVNQENRPEAEVVTYQLRLITINELLDSLNKLYTLTEPKVDSKHWLQTYAESLRFQSWKVAFDSIALQNSTGELSKFDVDLDQSIKRLKAIHSELSLISIRYEVGTRPVFTALQQLTGELIELLPRELQTTARSYQELQLLNDEAYLNGNDSMQNLRSIASSGSKLRYLAFVKRLLASADKQSKELELLRVKQGKAAIFVEAKKVELIDSFGDHHLALTAEDQSDAKRRVLIEWIVYDTHWDGSVMEEMVTRVGNIAHFLNEITVDARAFGLLHCAGYFHSVPRHSFGLVYNFPYDKARSTPETLNSIILESRGKPDPPLLGDRFALARSLSSILLDLHKATLVHKSFSSRNVIFFPTSDPILSRPYLIGFNHSRPNDPTAFSLGPASRSPAARKYQDPKYVPIERFRLEFDYYSLGLVLLEIGIWDTIDNMAKKAASPAEMKETLISKRVPLLGHVVGKAYRDAVLACLCGDFGKSREEASSNATILDFERRVLTPLSQLVA